MAQELGAPLLAGWASGAFGRPAERRGGDCARSLRRGPRSSCTRQGSPPSPHPPPFASSLPRSSTRPCRWRGGVGRDPQESDPVLPSTLHLVVHLQDPPAHDLDLERIDLGDVAALPVGPQCRHVQLITPALTASRILR